MAVRDPKEIVRTGWNQLSTAYRPSRRTTDAFGHTLADHRRWLASILTLPRGAKVLDLGCGNGIPDARLLARRFEVLGVDISEVQIDRARRYVPDATFLNTDMARLRLLSGSLDGAIALYSIIHLPVDEHPPLLGRIGRWLRPGAPFVLMAGATAFTGTAPEWLGSPVEMFWSHADAETYARWLADAGFEIARREFVPEGDGGHELFECRRNREPVPDRPLTADLL